MDWFWYLTELCLKSWVDFLKGTTEWGELLTSLIGDDHLGHPIPIDGFWCLECNIRHLLSYTAHLFSLICFLSEIEYTRSSFVLWNPQIANPAIFTFHFRGCLDLGFPKSLFPGCLVILFSFFEITKIRQSVVIKFMRSDLMQPIWSVQPIQPTSQPSIFLYFLF